MDKLKMASMRARAADWTPLTSILKTLFPILNSFKDYHLPGDLTSDLLAGSTVAILHIPQGMAYAQLAGVEPIYGLYVSFVPVLVLALMSRSRNVSFETAAILSMVLASCCNSIRLHLDQQAPRDSSHPSNIELLTSICLLVGIIQIFMSCCKLGFLSLIFNDQLISSFTAASAFYVVTSQMPSLFDKPTPSIADGLFKVCRVWWAVMVELLYGDCNSYTALLSSTSVTFLIVMKELVEPMVRRRLCKSLTCLPSELILMSCTILASWYFKFNHSLEIEVIGIVPNKLPSPQVPRLDLIPLVGQHALTIALISFALNLSIGQMYAKRNSYKLEPNQELFAFGTANIVGSLYSCFPCDTNLSRSAVQNSFSTKSQVCSLFSCTIVVLIICYIAPVLHDLPKTTLSCIIIVAIKGVLWQVRDLLEEWRSSRLDAVVWLVTFVSVLALDVTNGLVLGIAASLLIMFLRLLNPNHSILGQLAGTEIYVDRDAFKDCHEVEQVRIVRFNSALCYLNRTMFKACIEKLLPMIYPQNTQTSCNPLATGYAEYGQEQSDSDKIKFLVIDCSALAYCDYSGAETLVDIVDELEEHKVQVYLAACPVKLINLIERMDRTRSLEHNVHPTITDALNHIRNLGSKQTEQCSNETGGSCDTSNYTCLQMAIND